MYHFTCDISCPLFRQQIVCNLLSMCQGSATLCSMTLSLMRRCRDVARLKAVSSVLAGLFGQGNEEVKSKSLSSLLALMGSSIPCVRHEATTALYLHLLEVEPTSLKTAVDLDTILEHIVATEFAAEDPMAWRQQA